MRNITLKIDDHESTLGIRHLRVQQQINDIPVARLELRIPTDNPGMMNTGSPQEISRFTPGARVEITLDETPLFNGYLVQKKMLLKGKYWSVRLEARHALQKLTFLPRSRVFRQNNDGAVLEELLKPTNVKVKMDQQTKVLLGNEHDQLIQFRLSDWQFLCSRLLSTNCWLLPDAASDGGIIRPLSDAAVNHRELARDSDKYTLYEVNLSFDDRFTLDSLSLQGWDIAAQGLTAEQKSQSGTFCPWKPAVQAGQSPDGAQDYALAFSMMPEATLKTLSDSWLNHQQMTGVQGSVLLAGTRDFAPGDSLTLSNFGMELDGTVILSGVNQQFDTENGWRSELVIGMPASMLEPAPPVRSLHIAKVAEFTADPLNLERIAIHLPALNLPDSLVFARLSKPWASNGSGFCFYPEPGDEVVVGFIDSDPRYPMILGALHNPKNIAPFPPDEKNNRKELVVSHAGNTQALMINTDEKTLMLRAEDNTLTLTSEGGIQVQTPKALNLHADMLGLQAGSDLSIEGKQQVEITSAKINMKNNL
ncbi:phage baseplate assembly protein V [Enterobacter ludwigii]|uniref:phage baseplate assembly protein V n=1 Tax=Enterobacter ludwigii TaxID=299767 RepID=UPI003F714CBC